MKYWLISNPFAASLIMQGRKGGYMNHDQLMNNINSMEREAGRLMRACRILAKAKEIETAEVMAVEFHSIGERLKRTLDTFNTENDK